MYTRYHLHITYHYTSLSRSCRDREVVLLSMSWSDWQPGPQCSAGPQINIKTVCCESELTLAESAHSWLSLALSHTETYASTVCMEKIFQDAVLSLCDTSGFLVRNIHTLVTRMTLLLSWTCHSCKNVLRLCTGYLCVLVSAYMLIALIFTDTLC